MDGCRAAEEGRPFLPACGGFCRGFGQPHPATGALFSCTISRIGSRNILCGCGIQAVPRYMFPVNFCIRDVRRQAPCRAAPPQKWRISIVTTEDKTKSAAAGKQGRPSSSRPARNDTQKAAGTAGRRPAPRGQAKKPQNAQPPAGQPEKAAPPLTGGSSRARRFRTARPPRPSEEKPGAAGAADHARRPQ